MGICPEQRGQAKMTESDNVEMHPSVWNGTREMPGKLLSSGERVRKMSGGVRLAKVQCVYR
jgi:hypothetical protein